MIGREWYKGVMPSFKVLLDPVIYKTGLRKITEILSPQREL
jgi:hypothetical protein